MPAGVDPRIIEMTPEQIEAFLEKVKAVMDEESAMVAVGMATTIQLLVAEIKAKRISIARLKAILFGEKSEKTSKVFPVSKPEQPEKPDAEAPDTEKSETEKEDGEKGKNQQEETKKPGHGRTGAQSFVGATTVKVPHEGLKPGDECPKCPEGRVYPMHKPAVQVRIVGMCPLHAMVIERERLRCNACGEVFTAQRPDGVDENRFDETAQAMIAIMKYATGVPFYRLGVMAKNLGIPLSPSTQWDLVEKAYDVLEPVMDMLMNHAAQAQLIHNDDTTMRLLNRPDLIKKGKKRTGVYTTGLVARLAANGDTHEIAIFKTGVQHSGECLTELLKRRSVELEVPIQMCDALAANTAGDFETIVAHCMAHARRRFVEIVDDFPKECQHLLKEVRKIYIFDKECKEQNLSPDQRLAYHQSRSGPVMEGLKTWLEKQIKEKKVEPNSGLGTAIQYMLNHWLELTVFLREPGAPLDNNLCERTLKRAILHRKNSLFYKTTNGALVGDTFMSLIHTAEINGIKPFDYLVAILKHPAFAEENPEEWMPWNYQKTLAEIEKLNG